MLAQFLQLPVAEQQRLLEVLHLPGNEQQTSPGNTTENAQVHMPLQHMIRVLEAALSVC